MHCTCSSWSMGSRTCEELPTASTVNLRYNADHLKTATMACIIHMWSLMFPLHFERVLLIKGLA